MSGVAVPGPFTRLVRNAPEVFVLTVPFVMGPQFLSIPHVVKSKSVNLFR